MPLFPKPINKENTKEAKRGTEDVTEKCQEFIDIFDSSFVPAYQALSHEDQGALKIMFNELIEGKEIGDLLCECDKDALSDGFNDLKQEEKESFFEKMKEENIFE